MFLYKLINLNFENTIFFYLQHALYFYAKFNRGNWLFRGKKSKNDKKNKYKINFQVKARLF